MYKLAIRKMPKENSAAINKRVNVEEIAKLKRLCSYIYKSKASIEVYFNIADNTNTIPTKIRIPCDISLLFCIIFRKNPNLLFFILQNIFANKF